MDRPTTRGRARRWLAGITALTLAGSLLAASAANVAADEPPDMVLVWNENAINVLHAATTAVPPGLGQGPPTSAIHLAMVHGAIYDAVNAIDPTNAAYLPGLTAPAGASKAAAVAQAAHDVLAGLTPVTLPSVKARIDAMLTASLGLVPDGVSETTGTTVGAAAAVAMLNDRVGDGRLGTQLWAVGSGTGQWRPVPPGNGNVFAWAGHVTPFTMTSPSQWRTEGPLDVQGAQYAAEFNEVKGKGAATNSTRTPEETLLASFVSANPIFFMHRMFRGLAHDKGLSTNEQARFFVMTTMFSADALIGCFENKEHWGFWRPLTAIREAGTDGNGATSPDGSWLALYPTPPYPDEPSGYNCYTGAMMHGAKLFYGRDRVHFELTSPGTAPLAGSTRTYDRFTDVIDDTIDGRILTGFHFRSADVHGAWLGKKVAQYGTKHYFQPLD
jgi:hypothetical protein